MDSSAIVLALVTGMVAGGLFSALDVPIPAPPNLAGVMGIVGLFLGYRIVSHFGVTVDVLDALGI